MDPLSVTASVIAVLQLTAEVTGYLKNVKDAPKECQSCRFETSNLYNLLINLLYHLNQKSDEDTWYTTVEALNVENGPLQQYKDALEALLSKVELGDGANKVKKRLLWKFNKDEVATILARIERLKSLINVALQLDHIKLSRAIKDETSSIQNLVVRLAANTGSGLNTIHNDTQTILDDTGSIRDAIPALRAETTAVRDSEKQRQLSAVVEWLSPLDSSNKQNDYIAGKQENTWQGFLDSEEFESWVQGSQKTLFCPGIPGAGKTMVAATAIEYLQREHRDDEIGLAYLFCNYKSQAEQTESNLIGSLLAQLIRNRSGAAGDIIDMCTKHIEQRSRLATSELHKALDCICTKHTTVYFVVDALDECPDIHGARQQLIKRLRDYQNNSDVRLLFTSRFISSVEDEFRTDPWCEIRASEDDVRAFVTGQIPRLPKCIRDDEELQNEVRTQITEAADGMFLLALLHVGSLHGQTSRKKVRKKLESLQRGSEALEQAYGDAVDRIDAQLSEHRKLAKQALSWLTYAQRPLTTTELCHALAIEPGESTFDYDNLDDLSEIVSVCAGLLTIDQESSIVRLVHYTTQEYFERKMQTWNPTAQEDIAISCLTYLSIEEFKSGVVYDDRESIYNLREYYKFIIYAGRHWADHVRPVESDVEGLAVKFLRNGNAIDCITQISENPYFWHEKSETGITGMHLTAKYGLVRLAKRLLIEDRKADIYSTTSKMVSPLIWAAECNHVSMVELLIENGADFDKDGRHCAMEALYRASFNGHVAVVRLLLDSYPAASENRHALLEATRWGHMDIIKTLLLYVCSSIDANDLAIEAACLNGNFEILKLLLGRVSAITSNTAALPAASAGGHEEIVAFLLDEGLSVNQLPEPQNWERNSALACASREGHEQVVRLLLARGADVNILSESGASAIELASKNGHEQIVGLLLKDWADANISTDTLGTAIQLASSNGHVQIVRLLLENGADANISTATLGTAIQLASSNGHVQIVRLLLANGADANISAATLGTAIQLASRGGQEQIVRLLLENGADANACPSELNLLYNRSGTALYLASLGGHEQIVKALLENGAEINAEKNDNNETALHAASQTGDEAVVKVLLENGADVNAQNGDYGETALHKASRLGCEAVVKVLLEYGADVNAQNGDYGETALFVASRLGYEAVVKVLLEYGADVR